MMSKKEREREESSSKIIGEENKLYKNSDRYLISW